MLLIPCHQEIHGMHSMCVRADNTHSTIRSNEPDVEHYTGWIIILIVNDSWIMK
jgi:hypothetical protein